MITDVLMPRLDEAVHNADVVMQNRILKYKVCSLMCRYNILETINVINVK